MQLRDVDKEDWRPCSEELWRLSLMAARVIARKPLIDAIKISVEILITREASQEGTTYSAVSVRPNEATEKTDVSEEYVSVHKSLAKITRPDMFLRLSEL